MVFYNSSVVACVSPKSVLKTVVNLRLTLNNVHWYLCNSQDPTCRLNHPYYAFETRLCCTWTNSVANPPFALQLQQYSYAKRPTISALQPGAAPTRGDTNIRVIGTNIVGTIQGTVFACLIGSELVAGMFSTDGALSVLAPLCVCVRVRVRA